MSHCHVNAQVSLAQLPTAGQTSASQAEQKPHKVLVTSHSWEGGAQGRSTQHIFQNNFFLRTVLRQDWWSALPKLKEDERAKNPEEEGKK